MGEIILMISIIFASISVTTLGCVWLGTSYFKKKNGLIEGASQREIDLLQQKVKNVQAEIVSLKAEVQRLIRIAKGTGE